MKESEYQEGSISGNIYYCTKIKEYTNGANDKCNSYEKTYRDNYTCNKIYEME